MSALHGEVLATLTEAAKAYGNGSPFWSTDTVCRMVAKRRVRYPSFRAAARALGDLRRRGLVRHPQISGKPRLHYWSVAR